MRWIIERPEGGEVVVAADTAEEAARAFIAAHPAVLTWVGTAPSDSHGQRGMVGFFKLDHLLVSFAPVAIVMRRG